MGGSSYSDKDFISRSAFRSFNDIPTFKHDADIRAGKAAKAVHASLDPKDVTLRECRDSADHPLTMPIGVILDTTGSMQEVPAIIQKNLSKLMGTFLNDKVSGKPYLGDYYPAILIGAVDDYPAQKHGCLQVGQFESGIEIDDNLTNLWLTGNGGGTYEESYDLAAYFFARHTATDHWDKRNSKGYLFIIGDEKLYPAVTAAAVKGIIGDTIQADIPVAEIMKEVQERYNVFFVIPNMTSHWGDPVLEKSWLKHLPQQNVLKLSDPEKICELIAGAVAISEEHANGEDLVVDGVADKAVSKALAPLVSSASGLSKHSSAGLEPIGKAGAVARL